MPFRPRAEDVLGFLMTAYYGGRAECHIRHTLTRVASCDIRAMYPTVNVLMGLWRWWTAERLEIYDATDQVRDFVARVTLEDLLLPETWRHLPFLGLIQPVVDRLPVRAQYIKGGDYQVGLNYLTSAAPLWYTLADGVDSKLHTGKVPEILRALGFRPAGMNQNLRPVRFRGEVEIDPRKEDFIRRLVEERESYRALAKEAGAAGRSSEARRHKAMEAGLKGTANSTAYGTSIELNRQSGRSRRTLTVHGLYTFPTENNAWEQLGRFFHPAVGVMVTGGARLMLTLLEIAAKQLGADYAMMDTDSLAIAVTEAAPDPLAVAETVAARLASLNPFSFGGSILKVEDENFALIDPNDPDKGVDRSKPELLYYFGIAAKRYALCNLTSAGEVELRKYSEHGLGHLMSPARRERDGKTLAPPEPEESDSRTTLVTPGRGRPWIGDLWQSILERTVAGRKDVPRFRWSDLPALGRFSVSQPTLLRLAEGWNTIRRGGKRVLKPFAEQVKPTNFLLVAYLDTGTLGREVYSEEPFFPTVGRPIRPVAPYETNSDNWSKLPWRNLRNGDPLKLSWSKKRTYLASELPVQSYHDVISRFLRHPEAKSAGGDGIGVLQPLQIEVTGMSQIHHIGKEANRLDEVQMLGLQPDTYLHYEDEPRLIERTRAAVARIPRSLLSKYSGLSERQIARFVATKSRPHRRTLLRLIEIARVWEKVGGDPAQLERYFHSREVS